MGLLRKALVFVCLAGLVLTAGPALAGPPLDVKVSKHEDGPYGEVGGNVDVPIGDTKSLWWKVKQLAGGAQEMRFTDALTPSPNPEGLKIRWFTQGGKDITGDVKNAGYEFTLPNNSRKFFRARVKAVGPSSGACVVGQADVIEPPHSDTGGFAVNGPCA